MQARASLVLAVVALLSGCAARAASPTVTTKQIVGGARAGTCTATLTVHDVQVRAGCSIDERVTQAPGVLTYPCAGGAAVATFGASRFEGTVSSAGEVRVQIQTGFDFSDGCHWTSKQEITGRIGQTAWSYEYREEPDRGQRGCAAGCRATASVRVM